MAEGQSRDAGAGRTGVCRHCGALVGAGEERCMMCGTPVVAQTPEARPRRRRQNADPETVRFLRAVISRPATFTFVFIIANVFLYVLMWLSGGAADKVLVAYGAKLNYLIDNEGQWWRFVTPVFLHVHLPGLGPMHLIANIYGLFMLGPFVEKLYGSARFVVFWILTGVAGVVASYLTVRPELAHGAVGQFLFKAYDTPSAGASGALFGLIGVLFVFGLKYRHELPEGLKRAFGTGMLPTILVNLFIGYVARGFIDNAAHLGGLFSGMGLALLVGYKRPGTRGAVAVAWHAAQVACLALVVVSFAMVVRHFDAPPPSLSNVRGQGVRDETQETQASQEAQRAARSSYVEAINAGQNALMRFGKGDSSGLAPAVEQLEHAPSMSPEADKLRDELKAIVARARDTANDKTLDRPEQNKRMMQLSHDRGVWQDEFAQWAEDERKKSGVGMQRSGSEDDNDENNNK